MASENVLRKSAPFALTLIALICITLVWMSSFRLGVGNIELAWYVNFERLALAITAGIAFASTGALVGGTRSHIKKHILGFAVINTASTALLIGALWEWPSSIIMLASVTVGGAIWLLAGLTLQRRMSENLWSAAILAGAFGLSVVNFLLASSVGGVFGKLVYWLQGSLLETSSYSFLALLLCLVLFAWMWISKAREIPASLLLGLGIGIAGPLFFVACLVPMVVRSLTGVCEEKLFLITCGAVGALLVVLADSLPRLLIGGYSPSLLIPISLVSIPLLLLYKRAMLLADFPSRSRGIVEAGIILIWLMGFAVVLFHIVQFANLAA